MRLTLNDSVCTAISVCIHPCDTNILLYPQSHENVSIVIKNLTEFFFKLKNLPFKHNRNFNPKVIYIIIFDKTIG